MGDLAEGISILRLCIVATSQCRQRGYRSYGRSCRRNLHITTVWCVD